MTDYPATAPTVVLDRDGKPAVELHASRVELLPPWRRAA